MISHHYKSLPVLIGTGSLTVSELPSVNGGNEWLNNLSSPLLSSCLRETHGSSQFQSPYPRWSLCVLIAWPPSTSHPPCLAQNPRGAPPSTARPAVAPPWALAPAARPTRCTPWKTPTTTPWPPAAPTQSPPHPSPVLPTWAAPSVTWCPRWCQRRRPTATPVCLQTVRLTPAGPKRTEWAPGRRSRSGGPTDLRRDLRFTMNKKMELSQAS